MDTWSDGWTRGQVDGHVVRWMDTWSDGWTHGQIDGYMVRWMDMWSDGWTHGWTNGRKDGHMAGRMDHSQIDGHRAG